MRSCTGSTRSLAVVVMIVQVRSQLAALGIAPARPEARESEWRAAVDGVAHGALPAVGIEAPLVEAVGEDQAAALREQRAVGGLLGQRLGARVDHPGADLRILRPVRDETPACDQQLALVVRGG